MANSTKNPKKANLLDPHSIKHLLDESVTEIVTSRGYVEDFRLSNLRLVLGTVIIAIALVAQFYPKKFPENRDILLGCIGSYVVLNVVLQFIGFGKDKNAILFTYPPPHLRSGAFESGDERNKGSFSTTGLIVSSKLPRFSDMYTLTVASAEPKSISANKPVHFTKSVTKWFTKDGVLVEGLFWKDVGALIDDYNNDHKNK